MKKILPLILILLIATGGRAQENLINAKEVERIEKTLSSDDMRGRKVFTPDIDRAADFIDGEFKKTGLQTFNNSGSYRQEFAMVRPKFISLSATLDGNTVDQKNVVVITCQPELKIDQNSGYEITRIDTGGSLSRKASTLIRSNRNLLVMVDEGFAPNFARLTFLKQSLFKTDKSVVFILGNTAPKTFSI